MNSRATTRGRGVIETGDGTEIPVFYDLLIEGSHSDGLGQPVITGRLSIYGDPWLEANVIQDGNVLLTQEGGRFRVRVEPGGRGVTSLPFKATRIYETMSRQLG